MKILTVTGISSEHSFKSKLGQAKFYLILNDELRIEITEQIAEQVVALMADEEATPEEEPEQEAWSPPRSHSNNGTNHTDQDEDGIDQI